MPDSEDVERSLLAASSSPATPTAVGESKKRDSESIASKLEERRKQLRERAGEGFNLSSPSANAQRGEGAGAPQPQASIAKLSIAAKREKLKQQREGRQAVSERSQTQSSVARVQSGVDGDGLVATAAGGSSDEDGDDNVHWEYEVDRRLFDTAEGENEEGGAELLLCAPSRPFQLGMLRPKQGDPGETCKVLLVPGSEYSDPGLLEMRSGAAERKCDEEEALLDRQEQGLAVSRPPPGATKLLSQGRVLERLLREELVAEAEAEERFAWEKLQTETGVDTIREEPPKELQSAPFEGGGPASSWALCSDPVLPLEMRLERPTEEEEVPPPVHLSLQVMRPVCGMGPEARAANLHAFSELRVAVPRLALHGHPLFCAEDNLYVQARLVYGRYRAHMESNAVHFHWRRLAASVSAAATLLKERNVGETSPPSKLLWTQLTELHEDALSTLSELVSVEEQGASLGHTLYNLWRDIEECRDEAGFNSTPAKLVARKAAEGNTSGDTSESSIPLHEQIDLIEELGAWLAENAAAVASTASQPTVQASPHGSAQTSTSTLKQPLHRTSFTSTFSGQRHGSAAGMGSKAGSAAALGAAAASAREVEKWKAKVEKLLITSRNELLRGEWEREQGGHKKVDYVLRLTGDGPVTPDEEVPPGELARRVYARSVNMYAALYINGIRVTTTTPASLEWPDFAFTIGHVARLRLVRRPSSAQVRLYRRNSFFWPDEEIASVWVPIPGAEVRSAVPSHSLAPRAQWCQFSGERILPGGKRISGAVMVGMEWATETHGGAPSTLPAATLSTGQHDSSPLTQVTDLVASVWDEERRRRLRSRPLVGTKPPKTDNPAGLPGSSGSNPLLDLAVRSAKDPNDPHSERVKQRAGITSGSGVQFQPAGNEKENAAGVSSMKIITVQLAFKGKVMAGPGSRLIGQSATSLLGIATPFLRGCSYTNTTHWKEPLRHTLLRIRRRRPMLLGNRSLPLLESECRADDSLEAAVAKAEAMDVPKGSRSRTDLTETSALVATDLLFGESMNDRIGVDPQRLAEFLQIVQGSGASGGGGTGAEGSLGSIPLSSSVRELEDVKMELSLGQIIANLLPARKRALKPVAHPRPPGTTQVTSCRILVQLVGARNVPTRIAGTGPPEMSEMRDADDFTRVAHHGTSSSGGIVNSFVRVMFQECSRRTQTYDGSSPLWKETLELPFIPPGKDFSPPVLSQVNDVVHVSLFDQIEYDDSGQGGFLEGEATIRIEKHYLGSVEIPFQTIYNKGRLDCHLRLRTPSTNIGYETSATSSTLQPGGATRGLVDQLDRALSPPATDLSVDRASAGALLAKSERSTYLHVLVVLDPVLIKPDLDEGEEGGEVGGSWHSSALESYAQRWLQRLRNGGGNSRVVEVFVPQAGGGNVLLTRYLTAQEPPSGLDTVQKIVHFVRLIPFQEDWQATGDQSRAAAVGNMWCTSQQFLDIIAGDWEEHAVLLHNYLLWLTEKKEKKEPVGGLKPAKSSKAVGGKRLSAASAGGAGGKFAHTEVMLVLGEGVPEGDTVYVMVKEVDRFGDVQSVVLWNASTGDGFDVQDKRCPMLAVGCLVSAHNIWANIQPSAKPAEISWDVTQQTAWRPFFARPYNPAPEPPLLTIQMPLVYRPIDATFTYKVEDLLRETIKREVRRWRSRIGPTSFNADVSNRLGELLPLLEQQERGENVGGDMGLDSLEATMRQRHLVGFPIHSCLTSAADTVARVRVTGVHESRHPEVQFALAVQCFPYVNNIVSIWVYIAATTPKT